MDRLCRLTASLQNQNHKIQSNIFENISFEAGDQLTETAIFIATPMKFVDRKVMGLTPEY